MEPRELDRDVTGAAEAHQRLLSLLDDRLQRSELDPADPSALPGWTVGHVLTHLARNAESLVRVLDGQPQYPSRQDRDRDIEAGAARAPEVLVADVRETAWALERRWAQPVDWAASAAMATGHAGPVPMHDVPFRRWREVAVHTVDLGWDVTFADLGDLYVRLELRRAEMAWAARRPMGMTALPAEALARPPHERLAWLLGRTEIDGLAPAGILPG